MKKSILLLGLLLVLAACGPQERPYQPVSLTGTEGIAVSVVDAPSEVYPDEQFAITFEIENRGAFPVTQVDPGTFTLSMDRLYLQPVRMVTDRRYNEDQFWLEGKTRDLEGEATYFTAYLEAQDISRNSERVDTRVLHNVCYPYQANITTQVCIEQDRVSDAGAIICRNQPLVPPTPGGPVVISKVEVRSVSVPDSEGGGVRPTFRIWVENRGRGTPGIGGCIGDQDRDLNSIQFSAFLLDEPLICDQGSDAGTTVELLRGESMVQCMLSDGESIQRGGGNFQSLLNIYLDYTYRESDAVEVSLVR